MLTENLQPATHSLTTRDPSKTGTVVALRPTQDIPRAGEPTPRRMAILTSIAASGLSHGSEGRDTWLPACESNSASIPATPTSPPSHRSECRPGADRRTNPGRRSTMPVAGATRLRGAHAHPVSQQRRSPSYRQTSPDPLPLHRREHQRQTGGTSLAGSAASMESTGYRQ